jgi:hypothetical protein
MRRYGLIWESVPGARKGSTFLQPSGTDHAEKGGTEPPTQTQLVFPHLFANRDYTLLLLIQMRLIERKILANNRQAQEASGTCSEKAVAAR